MQKYGDDSRQIESVMACFGRGGGKAPPCILHTVLQAASYRVKGRVQSQMVFFLVLYLKTSFLVYICILGQIKRKKNFLDFFDFFGGHFGKKHVKYARARALTYVTL